MEPEVHVATSIHVHPGIFKVSFHTSIFWFLKVQCYTKNWHQSHLKNIQRAQRLLDNNSTRQLVLFLCKTNKKIVKNTLVSEL